MAQLAISGGEPVRTAAWPDWPRVNERGLALLKEVVHSGKLAGDGPMETRFAAEFAAFCNAAYGVCVSSGTAALRVALEAASIQAGDEVIVPGLTWIATASAVLDIGAVPVFADIDPDTYCLDPAAAADAITDRTRAIIPVHLTCTIADLDAFRQLAQHRHLTLIEDSAHSHGAQWRLPDGTVQCTGSIGDLGCFSFQASKVLTAGEGGIVLTSDETLADRCWSLRNVGRARREGQPSVLGGNFRITEVQAALLLAGLEQLPAELAQREENGQYLSQAISDLPGLQPMRRDTRIVRQGYYGYSIRYDASAFGGTPKGTFLRALAAEGIRCSPGFAPVYEQEFWQIDRRRHPFASRYDPSAPDYDPPHCPVAERAAHEENVVIPQPLLLGSRQDMDDIIAALTKLVEHRAELASVAPAA